MKIAPCCRTAAWLAFGLSIAGCQSLDIEDTQFGIISVPMTVSEGGGIVARPAAFFFEGRGVRLSTTQVGAEGCLAQDIDEPGEDTFRDIDAGDALTVIIGDGDTAEEGTLVPSAIGERTVYQLPGGESMSIVPGERVTVNIPGAGGGFPARSITTLTVGDFTPDPVTIPISDAGDVTVTWSPASTNTGTAMYYSFQYASEGETLDKEVACVFVDDGSGAVPRALLSDFRLAEIREAKAQRALISIDRLGGAITHFTTSLLKPVVVTPSN